MTTPPPFTSPATIGMLKIRPVTLLLCALALPACSNRQVYDAIQKNQQLECQKLPGTQYEECMKQLSEPYDTYKRERDELTKEK